jgi:hypothetical protein
MNRNKARDAGILKNAMPFFSAHIRISPPVKAPSPSNWIKSVFLAKRCFCSFFMPGQEEQSERVRERERERATDRQTEAESSETEQ